MAESAPTVRALDTDTWPAFARLVEANNGVWGGCWCTGKGHRRRGVASAALGGALAEIARRGGGTVEGYPEETDDRTVSGSSLHTGPMTAFAHHGFARTRPISPHRWVVTRIVDPVPGPGGDAAPSTP